MVGFGEYRPLQSTKPNGENERKERYLCMKIK